MKKLIRHWASVAFLFLIAALLIKCTKFDPPDNVRPEVSEFFTVTESGGTFVALDGNVMLTIPEGAVPQPVSIKISKFSSYSEELGDHLLLFPIVIKPLVGFDKNVQLSLRFDRELSTGQPVKGNMNLTAYNWYSEEKLEENVCENCENCCVDINDKMIKVCINRTGKICHCKAIKSAGKSIPAICEEIIYITGINVISPSGKFYPDITCDVAIG